MRRINVDRSVKRYFGFWLVVVIVGYAFRFFGDYIFALGLAVLTFVYWILIALAIGVGIAAFLKISGLDK